MFVLIETLSGSKESRIAAQVVSGIGFIGGGAILREGLTIRGVNTAATLWCSAAVGALCGTGLRAQAAVATLLILFANVVLRPFSYKLSGHIELRADVETHYAFQFTARAADESRLRRLFASSVDSARLVIQALHSEPQAGQTCIKATVISPKRSDQLIENVVETLTDDDAVSAISWEIVDQHAHE